MQVLYTDAFSSKIKFSNVLEHIKTELINQDKWNVLKFPLKYLEFALVTLSSIGPIGAKVSGILLSKL